MRIARDHPRLASVSLILAAVAIGVLVAVFFNGRDASASGLAARPGASGLVAPPVDDLPALPNMSALDSASTAVPAEQFGSLSGLPAPVDGNVHVLSSGLAGGDISISAWAADKGQVCFKSSFGSGGCFDTFLAPFIHRISDTDTLGEGAPLYAWGFVPDSVVRVSAKVAGRELPAVSAKNNTAFISLGDPTFFPDDIQGFTLFYKDGTTRFLPSDAVLPAALQKLKNSQ